MVDEVVIEGGEIGVGPGSTTTIHCILGAPLLIPKKIMDGIRRIMASFIWDGGRDTGSFHLVHWENIAKPKDRGGWGHLRPSNFRQNHPHKIYLEMFKCAGNLE